MGLERISDVGEKLILRGKGKIRAAGVGICTFVCVRGEWGG